VLGEMIGRLRLAQQNREAETRESAHRPGTRALAITRLTEPVAEPAVFRVSATAGEETGAGQSEKGEQDI
jgi:hypothetical protein